LLFVDIMANPFVYGIANKQKYLNEKIKFLREYGLINFIKQIIIIIKNKFKRSKKCRLLVMMIFKEIVLTVESPSRSPTGDTYKGNIEFINFRRE